MHSSSRPAGRRTLERDLAEKEGAYAYSHAESEIKVAPVGTAALMSPDLAGKRMRHTLVALLLLGVAAGAVADELWERALDVAAANQEWFASSVVIEMQQFNSRGGTMGEGTTTVTRSISDTGRIEESVTRSGGSPPVHENLLSGGLGLPVALRSGEGALGLFVRSRQDEVLLSRDPATERLTGGVEAAVYRYSQPSADGSMMRGRVWVDVATGVPLRVETIPDQPAAPLVSSTTLLHFEQSSTNWYPVRLEMTGTARRMMIERHIRTTVTISEYRRYRE